MADALLAIAENTGAGASVLTGGAAGKTLTRRWLEPEETPAAPAAGRTDEELVDHVLGALKRAKGQA